MCATNAAASRDVGWVVVGSEEGFSRSRMTRRVTVLRPIPHKLGAGKKREKHGPCRHAIGSNAGSNTAAWGLSVGALAQRQRPGLCISFGAMQTLMYPINDHKTPNVLTW
jgi:hypothetical protein